MRTATQIPSGSYGGYTSTNSAVPAVTTAIQTPNTFYWLQVGAETWFATWYNFADISLWSDYGINKSIYDPCPYGYRVPNNGSWKGFPSTTWTVNTLNEGATWNSLWWPAAGGRSAGSGALIDGGNSAYYWSSSRHPVAYFSYYLYFVYSGHVNPSANAYRGSGLSARCVQEEAQPGLPPRCVQEEAGHSVFYFFCVILSAAKDPSRAGCLLSLSMQKFVREQLITSRPNRVQKKLLSLCR